MYTLKWICFYVIIICFSVLDRVQSFLPQMAHANDELRRKMVTAPARQFDIENLDSATDKVIEMVNTSYIFYFIMQIQM